MSLNMNRQISSMVNYFCLFEGGQQNDFTKIKPAAMKLAHPKLTIHTGKGMMDKDQWLVFIESFYNEGGRVDLLSIKVEPDDSIIYKVRMTFSDGAVVTTESRATFKNGMLFHVEPFDPEKYNKFFEASVASAGTSPVAAGQ